MNDLSGSSFFPTETGRVDSVERVSLRAGASYFDLKLQNEGVFINVTLYNNTISIVNGPRNFKPWSNDSQMIILQVFWTSPDACSLALGA
ncbi:hypothetical protein TNCV_3798291 [Trichonephila clavipes]|nr:hypothetical protein TNCV_3798291 [Trichonephila clavipes]